MESHPVTGAWKTPRTRLTANPTKHKTKLTQIQGQLDKNQHSSEEDRNPESPRSPQPSSAEMRRRSRGRRGPVGIRKSINSPETGQRWDSGKTESRCGKQAPGTQGGRGWYGEKESPQIHRNCHANPTSQFWNIQNE